MIGRPVDGEHHLGELQVFGQLPDVHRHFDHVDLPIAILVNCLEPLLEVLIWHALNVFELAKVLATEMLHFVLIQVSIPINVVLGPDLAHEVQCLRI